MWSTFLISIVAWALRKELVKTSFQLCLYKRKKESLNMEIIILHRTCLCFRDYFILTIVCSWEFSRQTLHPGFCCLLLSCPFSLHVNKQWRGRKQIFCQGNAVPFGNTCLKRHILNLWINCTFFICHPLQKKKKKIETVKKVFKNQKEPKSKSGKKRSYDNKSWLRRMIAIKHKT